MDTPDISGVSPGIKESIKANIEEKLNEEKSTPTSTIGISISDSLDLDSLGFTNLHVQDAMVEIARYLLVNNCKLAYGGDLRTGGFTYIFSELANQYSTPKNYDSFRVFNYFAWPIHLNLSRLDDSEFKASNIKIEKLPPPPNIIVDASVFIKPDNLPEKIIWAKSLTYMRHIITNGTQARILIGGQVMKYMGIVPGLVEEAVYSIRKKQALFLCGAFGGATKVVINAILNIDNATLTSEFQCQNDAYNDFYNYWNSTETEKISYSEISKEFSNYGVKELSANNGLSIDENMRLFSTPHIPEMIYLILKGLKIKKMLQ